MKVKKRLLGSIMALVMVCALFPLSVSAAPTVHTLGAGTNSVTLSTYDTTTDQYVAEDGYLLTMTVDGEETPIVDGQTYTGTVVLKATPKISQLGSVATGSDSDYLYRAALFVTSAGIQNDDSVLSAILGTNYDADGVDGITVNSKTSGFSSIIVENNGGTTTKEYSIKNSTFNALSDSDGSDVSDFTGYGATIAGYGNVKLNLDKVKVVTTGVAKVAFLVDNGADMLVKDSSFQVLGGTLFNGYANNAAFSDMVAPPWVLGISGNARGTNLLGADSTSTFVDSDFETTGWGVLSVDSGTDGVINVINSTLKTISNTGYGIYAIGNATETFYGTTFNVGTYPVILTGGNVKFTSSEGIDTYSTVNGLGEEIYSGITSDREDGSSTVTSQFGVMAHNDGDVTLEKGTVFNTKNAAFLIKNGAVNINVDDSELNVEDGTILQMIDNDDNIVGVNPDGAVMPTFNTVFHEDAGYPTEAYGNTTTQAVAAKFTNVDLVGNMYNATGYLADAKGLNVTLGENATLKGAITASSAIHVNMELGDDGYYYDYVKDADGNYVQATDFTINEYYLLGHVANKAYSNGYNTVAATLTDNAEWTVTDTSYLNSLTIGDNASVAGKMTVNGVSTPIVSGNTYTGNIVLTAADTAATSTTTTTTGVKTGDQTNAIIWIMASIISALGVAGIYYKKQKATSK